MEKYSIITVCRNAEKEIGKTIESVLSQKINMNLIELIIVDGLSTDNTKNVIESYIAKAHEINLNIIFISEKDDGIYDAMNKGVRLSNGEWCIFLNAGDEFYNGNSFRSLIEADKKDSSIIYGDTLLAYKGKYKVAKADNDVNLRKQMAFCHQSCIIKTELLKSFPYSKEYRIASDYDFFLKVFLKEYKFSHVESIISVFEEDGISSTNPFLTAKEYTEIQYKYGLLSKEEYEKSMKKILRNMDFQKVIPKEILKTKYNIVKVLKTKIKYNDQRM